MYVVRRQLEQRSRQWGIYRDGKLVEGGFFFRDRAERLCDEYNDVERRRKQREDEAMDDINDCETDA